MQSDADVLIIGGGLSGLAAAFGLACQRTAVEVLEAAARAGGVIGTVHRDGALYETGPNSALDATPLINELLDALGIRNERVEASTVAATRYIVRGGALVPLPTSPGALLTSPAFSLGAKFRVWREPFVAPAPADADESVATFFRRRLGQEILDFAVDPFVAGVYAGDPDRLSLPAAFPRLHALEQKHGSLIKGQFESARERRQNAAGARQSGGSFSFRAGMQTLTDALARAVGRVTTNVRVQRIERGTDDAWTVTGTREGEPVVRRAKAVILAVPAYEAATLLRESAPAAADALADIDYAAIASIATLYRRGDVAHSLAGFGFLVPKKEQRRILGALFSSSMFLGRASEDRALITSFVGGKRNPDIYAKSDAEIAEFVHAEHAALIGVRNSPQWRGITRWPHAIPQYNVGHRERLRAIEDAARALPGLFVCANFRGGVSVGDCITSAHAASDLIARYLLGKPSA